MKKLFINFSDTPSKDWSKEQLNAVREMIINDDDIEHVIDIVDLPFPTINPAASTKEVHNEAIRYLDVIENIAKRHNITNNFNIIVFIDGDPTFTYAFVFIAKDIYIKCVNATYNHFIIDVTTHIEDTRTEFVQFREY